jgi:hypothetical protein
MRRRLAIAFIASLALLAPAFASGSGFRFKVPDGWIDLSPTASITPEVLSRLPPAAERIRRANVSFYAADLDHMHDGNLVTALARVDSKLVPITDESMKMLIADFEASFGTRGPDMSARVTEAGFVSIGGVTCIRFVGEVDKRGLKGKSINYLIPGHNEHAVLVYSTDPGAFAHYQPIFDAAAAATVGAEEPPNFSIRPFPLLIGALLIGFFSVWLVRFVRRRRRPV